MSHLPRRYDIRVQMIARLFAKEAGFQRGDWLRFKGRAELLLEYGSKDEIERVEKRARPKPRLPREFR